MVRRPIAVFLVTTALCLSVTAQTPEASLDLGLRAFRAGDYASARVDLEAAAAAVPAADLPTYVASGQLDRLRSLQTALVYLALTQFRLGSEDDSRATIQRVLEVERIAPMYATLPLQAEAAEFETLVAALVPDANLPAHGQTAATETALPLPPCNQ